MPHWAVVALECWPLGALLLGLILGPLMRGPRRKTTERRKK
jgi:hypothetical protein